MLNQDPPKLANLILRWFCREDLLEDIEGDISEIFFKQSRDTSQRKASILYFWNVIRFFRWSNFRKPNMNNQNNVMGMYKNYFKISLRSMARYKGYTMLNILGLTVGLASFILTFLYVQNEFAFDRFHKNGDNIYRLLIKNNISGNTGSGTAGPWAPAMTNELAGVDNFVRIGSFGRNLFAVGDKQFYESNGALVDSSFFNFFSFEIVEGDLKETLTKPFSGALSESMALKYFGDESPIGKVIKVDNSQEFIITAVYNNTKNPTNLAFDYLASFDSHSDWFKDDWVITNYASFIMLNANTSTAEIEGKFGQWLKGHLPEDEVVDMDLVLQPLKDVHLYSGFSRQPDNIRNIYFFTAIGTFILLIAIINFINLVTAQSAKRAKEVGIRKVIGASKSQLMHQFLSEAIFLVIISIFVASVIVIITLPFFNILSGKRLQFDIINNPQILITLFGITVITGLLAGTYPSFVLSRYKPVDIFKGKLSFFTHKQLLSKFLIILQFSMSIILVSSTLIVFKQLDYIQNKKLGFEKDHVLMVPLQNVRSPTKIEAITNQFLQNQNILSISASANRLGGGDWGMPFKYEGSKDDQPMFNRFMAIDDKYLETLGVRLLKGRNFSSEITSDIENSYLVNQSFVDAAGWEDPIGKTVQMPRRNKDGTTKWVDGKVIGVVEDFNYRSLHTAISPMVLGFKPDWVSMLYIKTNGENIQSTITDLNNNWKDFISDKPFDYSFLDQSFNDLYTKEQQLSKIVTLFSGIAIFLACMGLFSLSAFIAEQKTKEVGLRKIMGASISSIILLFSKGFLILVLLSIIVSTPIAWYYNFKWLNSFAYSIDPDLLIFGITGLSVLIIAFITVSMQSLKIAYGNPVDSLRQE